MRSLKGEICHIYVDGYLLDNLWGTGIAGKHAMPCFGFMN